MHSLGFPIENVESVMLIWVACQFVHVISIAAVSTAAKLTILYEFKIIQFFQDGQNQLK